MGGQGFSTLASTNRATKGNTVHENGMKPWQIPTSKAGSSTLLQGNRGRCPQNHGAEPAPHEKENINITLYAGIEIRRLIGSQC
jgi:hypothetical protein